jgi:radical SAM protein with 4Fe4S-binding SPASM domain
MKNDTTETPLVLIPEHFGSLVFDRRTSKYLPFDIETTELLLRLRAEPFDALLAATGELERQHQLTNFFEHFYHLGFFTVDLRFAGRVLDVEPPSDHLAGPLAVHLEVMAACNLRCLHCFAGELPRKERALTLDELDRLFADMASMGSFRLGLTGGEPLLRRDLFDIIDLAAAHGLCPCVTTNGLRITEQIAREFGKRQLVWLNVSLEGASSATNDPIRGAGTFDQVLQRLSILRRHSHFTLAFTLMSTNAHEVEACAELAYRVGADTAVFRPLYPVGVARDHPGLMPTFSEYSNALTTLSSGQGSMIESYELCSIDPFSPLARRESEGKIYPHLGCGAGNTVCSISLSGNVNPCSFLGPEYTAANLREHSLPEIWHSSRGFRSIRSLPDGEATGGTTFSGGCRARALVFNGSINAPDPWIEASAGRENSAAPVGPATPWHPLAVVEIARTRPTPSTVEASSL